MIAEELETFSLLKSIEPREIERLGAQRVEFI